MAKEKIISKQRIAGHVLQCPICGSEKFWTRKTLMNTPGMTIMGLDWANKEATNYICDNCDHIMWFMNKN